MKGYALITGASKGIGRAMAYQLAGRGYDLLLIARSGEDLFQIAADLKQVYGINVYHLPLDLSERGAAIQAVNWYKNLEVPLSILINNAGYGLWGKFEEIEIGRQLNLLDLNINAVVELTHLLLPFLKSGPPSFILNVASTAAYQAVPALSVYAASKAFILSFSRALRYELKDTRISVSCLCPGPTDTGFAHRAGMDALAALAAKFNMDPNEVAKTGLKGMFNKRAEIIPGFLNRVSSFGAIHLNKSLTERITASLYKI